MFALQWVCIMVCHGVLQNGPILLFWFRYMNITLKGFMKSYMLVLLVAATCYNVTLLSIDYDETELEYAAFKAKTEAALEKCVCEWERLSAFARQAPHTIENLEKKARFDTLAQCLKDELVPIADSEDKIRDLFAFLERKTNEDTKVIKIFSRYGKLLTE